MDADAMASALAEPTLTYIQYNTPRPACASEQPPYLGAKRTQPRANANLVENGQADRLEDQARAQRGRRLHPVKDDNTIALARQQGCTCKPANSASSNGDGSFRHRPAPAPHDSYGPAFCLSPGWNVTFGRALPV
jgi:hypothetical protein